MKKIICVLLVTIMMVQLWGCGSRVAASDETEGMKPGVVEKMEPDEAFASNQMEFALELFQTTLLESENKNVLLSPISVKLALAMTANGAVGDTREEMENVLTGNFNLDDLNRYLYSYLLNLSQDEVNTLKAANSIWFKDDESLTIEEDFLQKNVDYYGAGVYKAAFDKGTVKDMNLWVKQHTDGMIKEVVKEIDPLTVMYLLNALSFEAEWEYVYEGNDVHSGEFTSVNGEKRTIDMMYSMESIYLEDDKATGFIKEYKGGKYSFAALLPNEGVDIFQYIIGLTPEGLLNTLSSGKSYAVKAALPKFSCEYEHPLKGVLKSMGMETAFDSAKADFTGLGTCKMGNLYVEDVLHKTYIAVDELGTKAGAVTKVEMNCESAMLNEYCVTLDRPFVYMIVDNDTHLPIFMGTLMDTETDAPVSVDFCNHEPATEITTVENPLYATCGNTYTTVQAPEGEFTFWGSDSVALTNLVENLVYNPEAICRCPADYKVITEFQGEYAINPEVGFVRCEKGQSQLEESQLKIVREIMGRLKNN